MLNDKPLLLNGIDVQKLLGIGSTKFYEVIKQPNFPKARFCNGKRPMYLREEIEDWVKSLK